jgi:hypothetical protein
MAPPPVAPARSPPQCRGPVCEARLGVTRVGADGGGVTWWQVLRRYREVWVLDMFNTTHLNAHLSKPNDGRHPQPWINLIPGRAPLRP